MNCPRLPKHYILRYKNLKKDSTTVPAVINHRTPPVTAEVLEAVKNRVEKPENYMRQMDQNDPNLALKLAEYKGKLEILSVMEKWHLQFMKER